MRVNPWLGVAVALTAACGATSSPKLDLQAEAATVRAQNAAVNEAIQRKDLDAVAGAYAPDAALLWQNDPRLAGPEIRQAWAQAFGTTGFALRLHSRSIQVAQAGDLALDEGSLDIEVPGPAGVTKNTGKYLVVWKKGDGGWKILYDVYNTDPPATPAPAAPAGK